MLAFVEGANGAIESITGVRPAGCPWRAFYDPLVGEVMQIATLAERGIAMAALGNDPPAILIDALALYERCRSQTSAHWLDQKRKEREQKKR